MRYRTADQLDAVVANSVEESSGLEFKRDLSLGMRAERIEALKDLSGMGNGGGGTLLYGIEEDGQGAAARVVPLTRRGDVGRLEDLVRESIRPPILSEFGVVEVKGGFVLTVDVQRSPLGPYMVEAHDQRRYFIRIGSRTVPMTEQQVRDAYALAVRGRDRRADVWAAHDLPMPTLTLSEPWLVTSAIPEEPLIDLFDQASFAPSALVPPEPIRAHARWAELVPALENAQIWAEGFFWGRNPGSDFIPSSIGRIDRDGAMGLAKKFANQMYTSALLWPIHGQLLYVAWLLTKLDTRTPLEIDVRLQNPEALTLRFTADFSEPRELRVPEAVIPRAIAFSTELLPSELMRAGVRHGVVRKVADRINQAYGLPRAEHGFTTGKLYGRDGKVIPAAYAGVGLWDPAGTLIGHVYETGRVENKFKAFTVGFIRDGVLIDTYGRAIAALEFATGPYLPDDFMVRAFPDDPRARAPGGAGAPMPSEGRDVVPDPLGEWSEIDLFAGLAADTSPPS